MPEPTGQHTHILHQETGYEKGNEQRLAGQGVRRFGANPGGTAGTLCRFA